MRLSAVAVGHNHCAQDVVLLSYGGCGPATAALLAANGHRVQLIEQGGAAQKLPRLCELNGEDNSQRSVSINIANPIGLQECLRHSQVIMVCAAATEYGALCEDLCQLLNSGQTLLLVDPAFGAALEFEYRLQRRRADLSVNIVELSLPFDGYVQDGQSMFIYGAKRSLLLAGRSLNETRVGLSIGVPLFSTLVPASNLFERGFSKINRWQRVAAYLFMLLGVGQDTLVRQQRLSAPESGTAEIAGDDDSPLSRQGSGGALTTVMASLYCEFQLLAKAYGVKRLPKPEWRSNSPLPLGDLKQELAAIVIEDFVLLSNLARLAYLPVPVLDSVIELTTAVIGCDLRKEGRDLCDLGLIGMDAAELVEYLGA